MNVVSAVFLVVFAVIGICAFVRELTFFLFRNRKNNTVMFVAPVSGKCEIYFAKCCRKGKMDKQRKK